MPAIVSEPLRVPLPLLGLTLNDTVPLPLPGLPEVIEAHETLLAAVQLQPTGDVTFTDPVPPVEEKVAEFPFIV